MQLIKNIHILTVFLSLGGFILRWIWVMQDSPRLQQRWVRIAPHVNDTVLLIAAITLAVNIHQYPFVDGWLTAKVLALLVYIGLGMATIRHGKSKQQRIITGLAAILVFVYMLGVAKTRHAFLFF